MPNRFKKHYTLSEARELLPKVRVWLKQLEEARAALGDQDERLGRLISEGSEVGGPLVNTWVRTLAETKELLQEFHERDIQIKDLDRGLLDFPAFIGGKEVFLCWEQGEEDIEFWHELDAGYAGRERLE